VILELIDKNNARDERGTFWVRVVDGGGGAWRWSPVLVVGGLVMPFGPEKPVVREDVEAA
jgi:hypothetical protein